MGGGHRRLWTFVTSEEQPILCQPLGALLTSFFRSCTPKDNNSGGSPFHIMQVQGRDERDARVYLGC